MGLDMIQLVIYVIRFLAAGVDKSPSRATVALALPLKILLLYLRPNLHKLVMLTHIRNPLMSLEEASASCRGQHPPPAQQSAQLQLVWTFRTRPRHSICNRKLFTGPLH